MYDDYNEMEEGIIPDEISETDEAEDEKGDW